MMEENCTLARISNIYVIDRGKLLMFMWRCSWHAYINQMLNN